MLDHTPPAPATPTLRQQLVEKGHISPLVWPPQSERSGFAASDPFDDMDPDQGKARFRWLRPQLTLGLDGLA